MPINTSMKTPIYYGEDNDMPDPRRLDLAERQELAEVYSMELKELMKTPPPPSGGTGGGGTKTY